VNFNSDDDSRIRCTVRCLDADTVARARLGLQGKQAVKLPYVCKISGAREELTLVSSLVAEILVEDSRAIQDSIDAIMAVAVVGTSLCECDLATLTGCPDVEVVARLSRLVSAGLLRHQAIHGMNYYSLADGADAEGFRQRVSRIVPAADATGDSGAQ